MTLDELRAATASLPTTWISEVVLQTGRYDEMKPWYEAVLGQSWGFENKPQKPANTPDASPMSRMTVVTRVAESVAISRRSWRCSCAALPQPSSRSSGQPAR